MKEILILNLHRITRTRFLLKNIKDSPQRFFLVIFMIFAIIFAFLVPPFQTADEFVHFSRAYQISTFSIATERADSGRLYASLPASIGETVKTIRLDDVAGNFNEKYSIYNTVEAVNIPLNPEIQKNYDLTNTTVYAPTVYIVQALAIMPLRILEAPIVYMIFAARIANILLMALLMYISIKIFPYRKWTLAVLAITPMIIAQSATPSADVLTLGFAVLFLAMILRSIANDTKNAKNFRNHGWLMFVASIMILSKPVNIVLLPLILLVPLHSSVRLQYILKKITILSIPLIPFLLWLITDGLNNMRAPQGSGNSTDQLKFIVSQPWQFVEAIINTFVTRAGDLVFTSLIGNFGWLDSPLPMISVAFGFMLLGYALLTRYEKKVLLKNKRQYLTMWTCLFAYVGIVITSMYISWSPVRHDFVAGLQGRYFLPALFLLVPLLASTRLMDAPKSVYIKVCSIGSILLLCSSVLTIVIRYYYPYIVL